MKIKLFLCVLFSLFLCGCTSSDTLVIEEISSDDSSVYEQDIYEEPKKSIYVCVQGEVSAPGVFVLPEGSRVFDAVNEAGGLLETADVTKINLVSVLSDGMQIVVPSVSSNATGGSEERPSLVDINSATITELMSLPGIGDAKATAIIQYRDTHNSFANIDEIKEVNGIKESTFESIKDLICAN